MFEETGGVDWIASVLVAAVLVWIVARSTPSRATTAPRTGAGVTRHVPNACAADATAASTSDAEDAGTVGWWGTVTLTLVRAGNLAHAVSVDFTTVDGTATAGADYEGICARTTTARQA